MLLIDSGNSEIRLERSTLNINFGKQTKKELRYLCEHNNYKRSYSSLYPHVTHQ